MKITKEKRLEILKKTKETIIKQIVNIELDIRYLKRELALASAEEVLALQRSIDASEKMNKAYESKLEVLEDELKGK